MSGVTLFSTGEECQGCRLTRRCMDAAGIPYRDVDLTDPANARYLVYVTRVLGYARAPVVVVDDDRHWSGFRPDLISALQAGGSVSGMSR